MVIFPEVGLQNRFNINILDYLFILKNLFLENILPASYHHLIVPESFAKMSPLPCLRSGLNVVNIQSPAEALIFSFSIMAFWKGIFES